MRRLLQISDVHFGRPHRPEIAAGVLRLIAQREPDLVVVAGDLTQRAKPREFAQVRQWIDSMAVPTLAVPGNHDVPMYRFWERLFSPYGAYRKHFSANLEPVIEDDELFVIGINSAFNWTVQGGRVTPRRIRNLERQLAAAPEGKTIVAVVHHDLIPPPRFGSQQVAVNAASLVRVLASGGVRLVLSGHEHQSYCALAESYYPGVGATMVVAHSGTMTSDRGRGCERDRNTGFWIEIDAGWVRLVTLEWDRDRGEFRERLSHEFPAIEP